VPSCSGASNALTWTLGTGFGCNTISAGGSGPAATITATGTNQGTAALIAAQATVVTTVPSGAGVVMNITFLASEIIYNRGANQLTVYPFSSAQIEGNGANNPVLIAVGGNATFRCISTTQCYTGP
jgi:hypothetical protein